MSETKRPVQPVRVDYKCDMPGCTGRMRPTGATLMSNPPQYPHDCNTCGVRMTFRGVTYPYIAYEEVPQ